MGWTYTLILHQLSLKELYTGADLGFSRGGGRIFKKFSKILTTFFFRSTKLIFRALPKHCFAPILAKFSAPQANFWKNSQKSRFWALFEKFWQKIAFFWRALPLKNSIYWRRSVGQKGISEKVSKGGPFGSAGGRIPEEGASAPPP